MWYRVPAISKAPGRKTHCSEGALLKLVYGHLPSPNLPPPQPAEQTLTLCKLPIFHDRGFIHLAFPEPGRNTQSLLSRLHGASFLLQQKGGQPRAHKSCLEQDRDSNTAAGSNEEALLKSSRKSPKV